MTKIKKLYRSKKNRIIAGVCGGMGDYFELDSTFIRLLWIFATLIWGAGLIAYLIAWVVIPEKK